MIICIVYPQIYTIIILYCLIGWLYNLGITAKNNRHLLLSLHVYQEFNSSNVWIYKSVLEALFPRHFVAVEHRQLHLLPLCTPGHSIQVSRSFEFCLKFAWNTGSGQKCRRIDGKKVKIETLWTQPLPFLIFSHLWVIFFAILHLQPKPLVSEIWHPRLRKRDFPSLRRNLILGYGTWETTSAVLWNGLMCCTSLFRGVSRYEHPVFSSLSGLSLLRIGSNILPLHGNLPTSQLKDSSTRNARSLKFVVLQLEGVKYSLSTLNCNWTSITLIVKVLAHAPTILKAIMPVIIRLVIHIATDDSVGKVSPGSILVRVWLGSGRFQGYWRFCRKVGELEGLSQVMGFWYRKVDVCKGLRPGLRQFRNIFGKFQKVWMVLGFWEFAKVLEGFGKLWNDSGEFMPLTQEINICNFGWIKLKKNNKIDDTHFDFEGFPHGISPLFLGALFGFSEVFPWEFTPEVRTFRVWPTGTGSLKLLDARWKLWVVSQ